MVTGTNEIACSTIAAPTARSFAAPKKAVAPIRNASWKPPTPPGVGTATPTTSSAR